MKTMAILFAAVLFCGCGSAFALDIGPVHLHGTKVKVGTSIELKITAKKIETSDNKEVKRINGTRAGSDDKYEIRTPNDILDDKSKEVLKGVEADKTYVMKLERGDDDWKLLKIRKDD